MAAASAVAGFERGAAALVIKMLGDVWRCGDYRTMKSDRGGR